MNLPLRPSIGDYKSLFCLGVLGGAAGSQDMMGLSMYLIAHKQIDPRPLITEIIPFDDVQRAIDSVYSGENIAVLLKP